MKPLVRRIFREPFCGISHLLGALLSVAGLVVLLVAAAGRPWHVVAFSVYGASLVVLYAASSMAHSLHCSPETGARLDRLDFAAIFLLIAGTYTPICLVNLRGPLGWTLFGLEWGLAAAGICTVLQFGARWRGLRTIVYVAMGWLGIAVAYPLLRALPTGAVTWLLIGGAFYSVGAAIFFTNWPHLFKRNFAAHDLWHCMVLAGSACHYVVMLNYVA